MEKRCEFCMALRPVVFCKSDSAHLCLSCDAKVHSANALSYRHPRTLVCESCRFQPALVRCFDHQMFLCQSCDITHHASLDHQKKIVSCYMGCPSAKDLAGLWGFDLEDQSVAFSHSAAATSSNASSLVSESSGWRRGGMKGVNDDSQQKSSRHLILQQIRDLERIQLSEDTDVSCLARVKERAAHRTLEHSDVTLLDSTEEPLSSPFTQLDSFTNTGNGDTFWHPLHNNEIWLQNMQDLGVCDEVQYFDDVKIPDVDLTFRNFEELFGGEQEAPDNKNKNPSLGKLDRSCATTVEQNHDEPQSNHPLSMRPTHSISSFSVSRISGESFSEDELSPTFPKQQVLDGMDNTKLSGMKSKGSQYTSPRSISDFKKME